MNRLSASAILSALATLGSGTLAGCNAPPATKDTAQVPPASAVHTTEIHQPGATAGNQTAGIPGANGGSQKVSPTHEHEATATTTATTATTATTPKKKRVTRGGEAACGEGTCS